MATTKIELETEDGVCPAYVCDPGGKAPRPAVLFYMDGVGMRPSMVALAERLAAAGYYVLAPDLYWRLGKYEPLDPKTAFSDPAKLAELRTKFFPIANAANMMKDTKAFLAHFDSAPVKKGKIGTTGYCMGGRLSITAAGTYPDRIAAAAAYHPGGLVTDAPDSPHLLAPKIKARLYIGRASDDANFTDAQKATLEAALNAAKVDYQLETYPARHGWVPSEMPVHDPAQAERHWKTLLDLFGRTIAKA